MSQLFKATIMKLLGLAYLAVLLGVNSATAQSPTGFGHNNVGDIQINYYSDSNCSDYSLQVNVTWAPSFYRGPNQSHPLNWTQLQTGCYTYAYGNSVNIANCEANNCECWFYKNKNCGGGIRICMTAMLQPGWTTIQVSLTRLPTSPSCAHTTNHIDPAWVKCQREAILGCTEMMTLIKGLGT